MDENRFRAAILLLSFFFGVFLATYFDKMYLLFMPPMVVGIYGIIRKNDFAILKTRMERYVWPDNDPVLVVKGKEGVEGYYILTVTCITLTVLIYFFVD